MRVNSSIKSRQAFTLVELLIVITVIVAILAMSIPAVGAIRASQREGATKALLDTVIAAMDQYRLRSIYVPSATGGDGPSRLLWDFNGDRIIDGDPRKDDAFIPSDLREQASRAGYIGPVLMMQLSLSQRQVDAQGRLIDAWGQPLRLEVFPPDIGRLMPWSTGPDRKVDTTPDGDDIKPWSTHRER